MSNDTQRADQIAHRFYTKLSLVVNHARATGETAEPSPQAKPDKWFNLETPAADPDLFKEQTRIYRSISTVASPPSFRLQVLLCIPELANGQVLAYISPDSSRVPMDPTPSYILLETWTIVFGPHEPSHPGRQASDDRSDIAPSTVYKHGISLFRSIFTLLHLLPAWKLAKRLRRRPGGNRNGNFSIKLRVEGMDQGRGGVFGFDTPVQHLASLPTDTHTFHLVPHPTGTLRLTATYLTTPKFEIFDRESLLSSRFLSQDEGPEFTPTLLKNQQRESLSGSPGSLPIRTSLPRSPPSSIADRFVVAPSTHTRTTSLSGGSPRLQNVALPMSRAISASGANTTVSASVASDTSSRQGAASVGSREESLPVSALAARLRKESFGLGRGMDTSTAAGALPIRRPPLNPVHPFKSSTLSSGSPSLHSPSPSLRHQSPLSTGPSLPSRPTHSPKASRGQQQPPSPIGAGMNLPSPITSHRPSPPLAPSSLGDRRSLASVEGAASGGTPDASPRPGGGKRYSSSFNHRFASSGGAASDGSAGSAAKDGERVITSTSYLSTTTDDDDISAFVQDIDSRKPLNRAQEHEGPHLVRGPALPTSASNSDALPSRQRTMSVPGPMLTTATAVDEKLKQMNDAFLSSLQGFGNRKRQASEYQSSEGSSTARAPSSGAPTIGRRSTLDPLSIRTETASSSGMSRQNASTAAGFDIPLPPYVRPRFASTGSVHSGFSVGSEEVLGRMDPEIDDPERRQSRGSR
ncbi:autophagy-related protein 13-domain-containing protein [Cristinia sonorae]|uniref:Autophagy-related protein 13 n=1 Tax=Cristinia sonorae TaxID=1940300 RepID=A0A8K0UVD7_9AGAR|nr:autophagy-related protein 13-domain-containing protein [Cristinia sonorae]